MAILEPIRRGAHEIAESIGEGWDWLRDRSAAALTRFRRTREDDEALPPRYREDRWSLLPSDLVELDEEVVVRIEAPGLEEKDFSISIVAGQLVVRGQKRFERSSREGHYHLFESAYGAFERAYALPCEVDNERAEAKYKNGVLTIHLPRVGGGQRGRRIPVRAG